MAVTHELSVRQDLCNNVVDRLDGGVLRFLTAGDVTVGDGAFGTPAYGAADASAMATANAVGNAQNTTGGALVVAKGAQRSTLADVSYFSVTTTGGGGDYILTNTTIQDQEEIVTDSLTYTGPP